MTDLQALAAKVEAAEGADRELDEAIYRALGYWWDAGEGEWCEPGSPRAAEGADVPAFTASLDAAITLVPEGWLWTAATAFDFEKPFDADRFFADCGSREPNDPRVFEVKCATPALALCAAALRARAAGGGRTA